MTCSIRPGRALLIVAAWGVDTLVRAAAAAQMLKSGQERHAHLSKKANIALE